MEGNFSRRVPEVHITLADFPAAPIQIYVGDYPPFVGLEGRGFMYITSNAKARVNAAISGNSNIYVTSRAKSSAFSSMKGDSELYITSIARSSAHAPMYSRNDMYVTSDVVDSVMASLVPVHYYTIGGYVPPNGEFSALTLDDMRDKTIREFIKTIAENRVKNDLYIISQAKMRVKYYLKWGEYTTGSLTLADMQSMTIQDFTFTNDG